MKEKAIDQSEPTGYRKPQLREEVVLLSIQTAVAYHQIKKKHH